MGLEHHLNADFDLSLRSGWRPPEGEASKHRITDLAWHAFFLAEPGNSVLLTEPVPPDFAEYIHRQGIALPETTVAPDRGRGHRLSPFGWNKQAADLALHYNATADHPNLGAVRRVNGRRFSALLERELSDQRHTVAVFDSETELRSCLEALPPSPDGWVLKTEHGNAGMGNRRLRSPILGEKDLKVVRRFLAEDSAVVLEPWRKRLLDLCATFVVDDDGGVGSFDLHEVVNTADGALIGDLFSENSSELAQWRPAMAETVATVSARLAEEGYFGPACIDAFVWADGHRSRLRRLVDLNARREISAGASRLWRRHGGHGVAYWRFFNRRKTELPGSYPELEQRLGKDAFDRKRNRGVLFTAPLWLGPGRRSPAKIAVLMLGHDRDDALSMDRRLRERLEK